MQGSLLGRYGKRGTSSDLLVHNVEPAVVGSDVSILFALSQICELLFPLLGGREGGQQDCGGETKGAADHR